jgi:hypothetical protein
MARRFWLGGGLALLAFVIINLIVAQVRSDCGLAAVLGASACADDIRRAGWPLLFMEQGGFIAHTYFSTAALVGDVVIGLAVSAVAGLAAARWWPKQGA